MKKKSSEKCVRLTLSPFKRYLQPRPRDWHKGNAGHVLIVGGDRGFAGAVRMAAEAALRVGAGLVSVATHPEHAAFLTMMRPEIMSHAVAKASDLKALLANADVVVIGPGLGQSMWSSSLFSAVMACKQPMVVDADGLNLLAKKPFSRANWILTPHPGEAGRLLNISAAEIQANRLASVKDLQQRFGGECVLKGMGTLVVTSEQTAFKCSAGNPGMASGGMGDVLSGVLGGLVSQGLPLSVAARLGVLIHSQAADLAVKKHGERGLLAMDLLPFMRQLMNPV